MTLRVLLLALALTAPGFAVAAEPPALRDVAHINDRLLAAAIGDRIRRECPTISERRWVVRAEALKLYNHALGLGHTRSSIEAYLDDPEARAAMDARRDAWLAANGARPDDADSLCQVGRREIEQGTYLGSLMRVD